MTNVVVKIKNDKAAKTRFINKIVNQEQTRVILISDADRKSSGNLTVISVELFKKYIKKRPIITSKKEALVKYKDLDPKDYSSGSKEIELYCDSNFKNILLVEELFDICTIPKIDLKLYEMLIKNTTNFAFIALTIFDYSTFQLKNASKELLYTTCEDFYATLKSNTQEINPNTTFTNYDEMTDGHSFEMFCSNVLRNNGFNNVRVTSGSGDQGIDILCEKEEVKYGIQCKCYTKDIGNKAIQEAYSGATYYKCHVPVVLTNRGFTKSARALAQETNVLLWDRDKLDNMINSMNNKE